MSRALLLLACATSLMGCILRDFDYQEPANVPPSVHGTAETPTSEIRIIDLDAPVGGDAGGASDWRFVATVRDANVGQPLFGLIYLDRNPDAPATRDALIGDIPIPVEMDEDPLSRRVEFRLTRADLRSAGCHVVELHVTSAITGIANPQPADPRDVGIGTWFVGAVNDDVPTIDLTLCPTYQ